MNKDTEFINIMRQTTYFMLYCSLMEMGAGEDALKAFEEYKKADLQGIQTAGAWVREWQQARTSELIKDGYVKECDRQKQEMKKRAYEAMRRRENEKYMN